ncbi:MAG: hypothetical protein ACLQIB_31775 [Isosphaeraceae bacterium]
MAPDDASETSDRADPIPQPRRTTFGRISQLVLAMFYFAAGAILINRILSPDSVTTRRQMLLAGLVGLMFLLASVHLVIYRLGLKLQKGAACPRPSPPERIR